MTYQCPVCREVINSKDKYIDHMRDEFEEHQELADTASEEVADLGAEL